jgi:hypothetical protein
VVRVSLGWVIGYGGVACIENRNTEPLKTQ